MIENQNIVEVLIVEDNPSDAALMLRVLKKNHLGNAVLHVEDGPEALDFLFARGKWSSRVGCAYPRVVFLDLKLPKMDGVEVLRELRSHPQTRNLPVVVVTSSREDPDIASCYNLGANSYVVKPVDFDAFVEAVTNLGFYWLIVNQAPINTSKP